MRGSGSRFKLIRDVRRRACSHKIQPLAKRQQSSSASGERFPLGEYGQEVADWDTIQMFDPSFEIVVVDCCVPLVERLVYGSVGHRTRSRILGITESSA